MRVREYGDKRVDTHIIKKKYISKEEAACIARREYSQVKWENLWIFSGFCYEYGLPVYQIKAYNELSGYEMILDAADGSVLKKTEKPCLGKGFQMISKLSKEKKE